MTIDPLVYLGSEPINYYQYLDGFHPPEDQIWKPNVITEGVKHDEGKLRWGLLPFDGLSGIVQVLTYGAGKYGDRNWELGMDWDRPFDACLRHLTDWYGKVDKGKGPGKDADTGYSDLWHAGCCILFLITYELRNKGKDTRPCQTKVT